jgi:hypothetical protein
MESVGNEIGEAKEETEVFTTEPAELTEKSFGFALPTPLPQW